MIKAAPDFSLLDQDHQQWSRSDFLGHWLVLYFYPKDDSLNCTREACTFRDEYRIIAQFGGAKIVGINPGSVESHKKFSMRHHLNFPILSDPGHQVTKEYGAWGINILAKRFMDKPFRTKRNTYLIDPDGIIVKVYTEVNPTDHALNIIADLQELQTGYKIENNQKA